VHEERNELSSIRPFELELEDRLAVEAQRFASEWLFKWHGMSYAGTVTDVDDFRGRRIHYEGMKYGAQQQQIFWDAVHRYLRNKVEETFKQWEVATANYSSQMRLWSLDGVERSLRDFQVTIRRLSMATDRRLLGEGYPESVGEIVTGPRGSASTDIARMAQAHRALLIDARGRKSVKTGPGIVGRVHSLYHNHRRLIWLAGVIITALTAIAGFSR
jgi:hypothetical protein